MLKKIIISILLLQGFGCSTYTQTSSGLLYKTINKGNGKKPRHEDYILLKAVYTIDKKKILYDSTTNHLPVVYQYKKKMPKDGSIQELITLLEEEKKIEAKIKASHLLGKSFDVFQKKYNLQKESPIIVLIAAEKIMTPAEYTSWQEKNIQQLQNQKQQKMEKQKKQDIAHIDAYVKKHNLKVEKTATGLQYIILQKGLGDLPQKGQKVKVHYTGKTFEGKLFDTSLADVAKEHQVYNAQRTYEPIAFTLGVGQVIAGWDEAIALFPKGSKAKIFIPSYLAYGDQAMGDIIPANSILVFDIELVDITN